MLRYHIKTVICLCLAAVSMLLAEAQGVTPDYKATDSSNDPNTAEAVSFSDLTAENIKAINEDRRILLLHGLLVDVPRGFALDYAVNRLPAKDYFDDTNTAKLAEAAKNGDIERVNALVAGGENPNAKGLGGFTPLMYSMAGKTTKGFQRLLELGGDPNLQTEGYSGKFPDSVTSKLVYPVSAMSIAAGWPGGEYLKLVLAHSGNPNLVRRRSASTTGSTTSTTTGISTPISDAIIINDPENARLLIKAGADLNPDGHSPLMSAAFLGSYDVMYVLLEAGADFRAKDAKGFSAIYYILTSRYDPTYKYGEDNEGRKKCMEFMEKKGVDFNKEREQYKIKDFPKELTAAEAAKAAEAQKQRRIESLTGRILSAGKTRARKYPAKEYFDDAKTAELAEAAKNGDIERVNALVAAGANPNAKGLFGFTPLMYSMTGKTLSGFQRLLELGGDPNLQTPRGESAMSFAASRQESESLKLVLAHGGNPNLVYRPLPLMFTSHPITPIFETVGSQNPENARILIKAGADLNARGSFGKTPLLDAATLGSYDVMYVLLEAGADIRAKEDHGLPASYFVLFHDKDYNPLLDECQSQKKCREFMEKKGVDFKKEKIQNEEILLQIQKRNELDGENGRQSQEGKNTK
jgi:uncharacterized protein